MKKIIALLALLITFAVNAQTKYDKTITVIVQDFSEKCGQDPGDAIFCLTDEKGVKIPERYSCIYDNQTWQVEPKDLITKEWILNAKYKGKKAVLFCMKSSGGAGWVVSKVEFSDVPKVESINQSSTSTEQTNDLDKYLGLYLSTKDSKYCISIGRFPTNTMVWTETGKYIPLDKKFIGKYFMSSVRAEYETSKVASYAGGYVAPRKGSIILGIDKDGTIHTHSFYYYNNVGGFAVPNIGGTTPGTEGKFVPGTNDHQDIMPNPANLFIWNTK